MTVSALPVRAVPPVPTGATPLISFFDALSSSCEQRLRPLQIEFRGASPHFLSEIFEDRVRGYRQGIPDLTLEAYSLFMAAGLKGELVPEPFTTEAFARELDFLSRLFSNDKIAGTKAYASSLGMDGLFMADFDNLLLPFLQKRWAEGPATQPLLFRIVGLGRGAQEYLVIAKALDRILPKVGPPGSSLKDYEVKMRHLGIEIRLYDRRFDMLREAEMIVEMFAGIYPWLEGHARFTYTDMVIDELFEGWQPKSTAVVFARNSMRDTMVELCSGFLTGVRKALAENGLFVVDSDAAYMFGTSSEMTSHFTRAGGLGLEHSEDFSPIFRRW